MTGAEPNPGDVLGGHLLQERIGEGGMGVVWRAWQERLHRPSAVKVVRPDLAADLGFQRRFEAEARAAAAIDHPNVVTVYDAGEQDGWLYLAMRYVAGPNVRQVLDRGADLPVDRAVDLVSQVAAGLDAAHRVGLVHRDVKPANVLIAEDEGGRALIADFGIAKAAGAATMTGTGTVVGTLSYAAPEQIQGTSVDQRADVYALGAMLYELLTHRLPFERESPTAQMWAHVHEPPPRPSDVRPELAPFDTVVGMAMAKDRNARFASAGALAAAARTCLRTGQGPAPASAHATVPRAPRPPAAGAATLAGVPPTALDLRPAVPPPPPPAAPPPRGSTGRTVALIAGVLALLVVGGVAAVLVSGRSGSTAATSTESVASTPSTRVTTTTDTQTVTKTAPAPKGTTGSKDAGPAAVDLVPFEAADFSAERPSGWNVLDTDTQKDGYTESRWSSADDPRVKVKIDHSPDSGASALESATTVRDGFSKVSSYNEIAFEETDLGGRPAVRWEFQVEDKGQLDHRIDWFVKGCDQDFAIWGTAPDSAFSRYEPTFAAVAESVTANQPC